MAHTLIWCLMFSMVIVFVANLSLIFIDYLSVPKDIFGYYQSVIMASFFAGSMGASYLIKKAGMFFTKILGSLFYLFGILMLAALSFLNNFSPLLLVISMAIASIGSSLAMTIYFAYSMSHIDEHLKGSALSLVQSFRLFLTSALVSIAANAFDGTTKPMSILAILCTLACILLYLLLYKQNEHYIADVKEISVNA